MNVVAFIPLRAGGSRVGLIGGVDKERAILGDKPLMAWTIWAALESGVFDKVIAVTRRKTHMKMARKYGATIMERPEYTVTDTSPDIEWVEWALHGLWDDWKYNSTPYPDAFAILRATSPFRTAEHIKEAYKKFFDAIGTDSLRTVRKVTEHPGKMWRILNKDRMVPVMPLGPDKQPWHSSATQTLFPCYIQTAGMEFAWSQMVLETGTIAGNAVVPYVVEGAAALDINEYSDWLDAERIVKGKLAR